MALVAPPPLIRSGEEHIKRPYPVLATFVHLLPPSTRSALRTTCRYLAVKVYLRSIVHSIQLHNRSTSRLKMKFTTITVVAALAAVASAGL